MTMEVVSRETIEIVGKEPNEILSDLKFVSPCPPPTSYQRELLEILIEECAEVQQRATKMLRFGVEEVQPGQELTNAQRLAEEFGDLRVIATRCQEAGMLPQESVWSGMERKRLQLAKYMQTTEHSK